MRKFLFVVLLITACGRRPADITIAVTRDGFVKFEGNAVTLDDLGTLLAARRDATPLETLPDGSKASSLSVRLDVEDETLWRHVSWVMTVLMEQNLWRLSFPGLREAPLPRDSSIRINVPADGKALLVRVLVLEGGAYAVGDRRTRDVEEIGKWIDAAPREGILRRIGEIGEQQRTTWRLVRPVFDLLRGRGMRIEFPCSIPTRSVRAASPLPPPKPWTHRVGWSGVFVVDYWSGRDVYGELWDVPPDEPALPEEELLALLDTHRGGLTLPGFAPDEALTRAAVAHAWEMSALGYFGHFSPTPGKRSPSDRLAKLGWPEERRHAELLAKTETAAAAFEAFLANPENAAVLADPAFKHAGVAHRGDCWVVLLGAER